MKTSDAIQHFGSAANLARALKITRAAVSLWGECPPLGRQYELEVLTDGALKAARPSSDAA